MALLKEVDELCKLDAEDVEELRRVETLASRPRVKALLQAQLARLSAANNKVPPAAAPAATTPRAAAAAAAPPLPTTKLQTFAWDQSAKFLKIYVTLKEAESAGGSSIVVEKSSRSVALRVNQLKGQNYEFSVTGLQHDIDTEKSFFKLKKDTVLLMLKKKAENITWDAVTLQEKRAADSRKPKTPKPNEEDPSAGLMGMMKQMYDDGDDEMKRTIRKAWHESQDKKAKGAGGDMGGFGDMGGLGDMGGMGLGGD